jgi:hypothetical protein
MNSTLLTMLNQVKRFFTVELQLRLSNDEEMDKKGGKIDSVLVRGTDKAASCYWALVKTGNFCQNTYKFNSN